MHLLKHTIANFTETNLDGEVMNTLVLSSSCWLTAWLLL